jgi:hypothetical protein
MVIKLTKGGCGITYMVGGNGEANVEFLLTTVYETVDEYLRLGANFINVLRTTFVLVGPKSIKRY